MRARYIYIKSSELSGAGKEFDVELTEEINPRMPKIVKGGQKLYFLPKIVGALWACGRKQMRFK